MAGPAALLTPVVIAVGSNLDSPAMQVTNAIRELGSMLDHPRASGLFASPPMYLEDQPEFVNAVCTGLTDLGPLALHALLKRLEAEAGRTKSVPNGPRVLDLDLIAYGCLSLTSPGLTVPHPRAMERRFVVEPWLEVAEGSDRERLRRALESAGLEAQCLRRVTDAVL